MNTAEVIIETAQAAGMEPLGLRPTELADWNEAVQIAGRFTVEALQTTLAVKSENGHATPGTLAGMVTSTTTERVQIRIAAARLADLVHRHDKVGSSKVYHHRIARLPITTGDYDTPDLILYLIEIPELSPLSDGGRITSALVRFHVERTYTITDRETGELIELADEGQFRAEELWQSAAIVRLLDRQQTADVCADMTWEPDVRNAAWAFSALRRLSKVAERRSCAPEQAPADEYSQPF